MWGRQERERSRARTQRTTPVVFAQAVDWLASRRSDLNLDEQRYIEASVALRQRAEEEKEGSAGDRTQAAARTR